MRAISNIGSIFRSAKSPGPLPDKIHYTALKQAGRPFIQPKSFLAAQVKTSYLNQLKNEIAKARGVSKEDALPIAEQTLGPLCKAAESGSLMTGWRITRLSTTGASRAICLRTRFPA